MEGSRKPFSTSRVLLVTRMMSLPLPISASAAAFFWVLRVLHERDLKARVKEVGEQYHQVKRQRASRRKEVQMQSMDMSFTIVAWERWSSGFPAEMSLGGGLDRDIIGVGDGRLDGMPVLLKVEAFDFWVSGICHEVFLMGLLESLMRVRFE